VTPPRFPLRERLRDAGDDVALQRIWRAIDARFPRRHRPRSPVLAVAAAALIGAAAVALYLGHSAGPLRLADGAALSAIEAPAAGATVALSDGSVIRLSGGARLAPLESSGTAFAAVLKGGSAGFDVRPGGPRRWRIECGLATVEVVGTRFNCDRGPGRLRVSVQRGAVLVSGERVADRVRRLGAGESLTIEEREPTPPAPAIATAAPAADEGPVAPEPPAAPAEAAAPERGVGGRGAGAASWRELARRGRHRDAWGALGAQGVRREVDRLDVEDLFALADVARLSGHPADAEAPLERIVSRYGGDRQAPLAAFALGRLELDALDRPARAAAAFDRALALGAPESLREDVRGRLVEAHLRAGDRAAARAAAEAYAREFPGGRYAATVAPLLVR
jgi:transmembrane sensor